MILNIGFVVGLILVAVVISILYLRWMVKEGNYEVLEVDSDTLYVAGTVYEPDNPEVTSIVVIYRSDHLKPPWELESRFQDLVSKEYPDHDIIPIQVTKEPGYNATRILVKQKDWACSAAKTWTSSVFHALVAPIELIIRWRYFPIWALLDFVSHDRKVMAAVLRPKGSSMNVDAGLSILESFNGLYIRYERK